MADFVVLSAYIDCGRDVDESVEEPSRRLSKALGGSPSCGDIVNGARTYSRISRGQPHAQSKTEGRRRRGHHDGDYAGYEGARGDQ